MAKVTVDQYLDFVRRSKLVEEAQVQRIADEARASGRPLTVEDLSKRFIEADLITSWQNDKLVVGKHQGFFLGKYKLLRHINSGGMSSVYLAEHMLMKRRVAVKVLPPAKVDDSTFLPRFQRECQAMASLNHPNIVQAHDFDVQERLHYMVMEYIEGEDLQHVIEREKKLDFDKIAESMRQAAEGLQHAHDMNMVHRDMKPANLMLDKRGMIKVLDLGVARITGCDEGPSLTLAHNEDVLGTADFLAPEQAMCAHEVDSRADIYALGCTMYYMICGHVPFREPNLAKKLMAHQTQMPPPIPGSRPECPEELVAICDKMMSKTLDDRYQTMREVSADLSKFLDARKRARETPPPGPKPPMPKPSFPAAKPAADAGPVTVASLLGGTPTPAPAAAPAPLAATAPAAIAVVDEPLTETIPTSSVAATITEEDSVSAVRSVPLPASVPVDPRMGMRASGEEVSQYAVAEPIRPAAQATVPIFQGDVELAESSRSEEIAARRTAAAATPTARPQATRQPVRTMVDHDSHAPAKSNGLMMVFVAVLLLAAFGGTAIFFAMQPPGDKPAGTSTTPQATKEAAPPPVVPSSPKGPDG